MTYIPSQKTLERYADVLVNFALGNGKGIKRGDTVRLSVSDSAKPLYVELHKAIIKAGGNVLSAYNADSEGDSSVSRNFFTHASDKQLSFYPKKYYTAILNAIDHNISIISENDKHELRGIDPKKIMKRQISQKNFREEFMRRVDAGKISWTGALYGTEAMAKEAGLPLEEYWNQIIKACFLDKKDPIAAWKKTVKDLTRIEKKLTSLKIAKLHIEGPDVDLWITPGEKRRWITSTGQNIPSFEIFISPDWRGTEGWIRFNQPLYMYGNVIEGIELEFQKGRVVRSAAKKNEHLLKEMIATKNADKVGEFSLTDRRYSRITKFMAHTLYDENIGGRNGNTHIALGMSYKDTYKGNPSSLKKSDWKRLGLNDSVVHTDIMSTSPRTVTAYLKNGSRKMIYKNGIFTI